MRSCLTCSRVTANPKFCSRRCAAITNNTLYPKRTRRVPCKSCSAPVIMGQRLCDSCAKRLARYRNKPARRRYLRHYMRDYRRRWRREHPEYARAWDRESRRKLRLAVMEHLGGRRCSRCGCADLRILEINHVNGGGRRELKALGGSGETMMRQILRGERSGEFNVLCRVCNAAHSCEMLGLGFEIRFVAEGSSRGPAAPVQTPQSTSRPGRKRRNGFVVS